MIWLAFEPDHEPVAFTFGYGCRIRLAAGPCLLLALSCRAGQRQPRQLSGVKRTQTFLDNRELQNRCSTAELTRRGAYRVDNLNGTFTQRIPDHTKGPK
jgi:hypothetical protein